MNIEYIGELLPDGHLSVDPLVADKLKKGKKFKIKINDIEFAVDEKPDKFDAATLRILERMKSPPKLGVIKGYYKNWR